MFGAECLNLPRIQSFEEAAAHEAAVVPIRGRSPECKPLGKRTATHMQIIKGSDEYICRLYNTDVVTYHVNGDVRICMDGWSSRTTMLFISELTGIPTYKSLKHVWVDCYVRDAGELTKGTFRLDINGVNTFRRESVGGSLVWVMTSYTPMVMHVINRRALNTVRSAYKPFMDYARSMLKLHGEFFDKDEMDAVKLGDTAWGLGGLGRAGHMAAVTVLTWATSTDTQDHHRAFMSLARAAMEMTSVDGKWQWHVPIKKVEQVLRDLILQVHAHEVLTAVPVPVGTIWQDKYEDLV
jgi:hypothetical protein